jgi:NADPH:quinone reductase
MLGLVNTPNGKAPVELRELPEPRPARNEALVAVRAFSLNRGELRLFANNEEGWVPGQDVGGVVVLRAGPRIAGVARCRRIARSADRCGTQLARHRRGGRPVA